MAEHDGPVRMLPGQNFSSGSTTLFDMLEKRDFKATRIEQEVDAVNEHEQEILANAIPAERFDDIVLQLKPNQQNLQSRRNQERMRQNAPKREVAIRRGLVMRHVKSGKLVVVVKPDIDSTTEGEIRHLVMLVGTSKMFRVPESKLEVRK